MCATSPEGVSGWGDNVRIKKKGEAVDLKIKGECGFMCCAIRHDR